MNPGSNLFLRAIRLINPQPVDYYAFSNRTQNAVKQWSSSFSAKQTITASVQAVSRNVYKNLGLDFQKNYIRIFVSEDVVDVQRDTSGDRFVVNGRQYQLESQTTWFFIDGWIGCTAVDLGPFSGTLI